MVVWGGRSSIWDFTVVSDGAAYQPSVDGWTVLESEYAPLPRMAHTAVWTGSEMIVWGGSSSFYYMDAGFYEIADGDGDGVCGDDDCDPFNPNCGLDCTDADLDGYCVGFDCDDSLAECAEDCSDDDGDGLAACQGDCDDANPAVLPGLDEICTDNADNDCDGMIDAQDAVCAGLVTGGLAFDGKDTLTWNGAATANTYGLYRGSLPAKGFAGYDHVCEATELTETAATDLDLPEAGHGFYYLVAGQEADSQIDKFTGGPLGFASGGVSRPTSESITCGPRLYVDPDVLLEDGDGLSWYTAYSSVSYALEHPAYRDRGAEIWVRGTVTEAGVELQQIDRPGVRLLGGFSGTEVSAWQRTPELTPTIWSGGGGLTLFRASGTSVVFDSFTVRAAISGFVGDPAGRLTEFTNVRMEQISDYGIRVTLQNRGTNRLIVRDSEFVSTGLGAIEVVAQSGLLTGEIRDSVFADWTGSALKLETRAQTAAEFRLDILSNVISGGGTGIVIRAQVNDTPGPSIQSSFIGSNLIHGTTGPSLSVEAYGYFDFEDGPCWSMPPRRSWATLSWTPGGRCVLFGRTRGPDGRAGDAHRACDTGALGQPDHEPRACGHLRIRGPCRRSG